MHVLDEYICICFRYQLTNMQPFTESTNFADKSKIDFGFWFKERLQILPVIVCLHHHKHCLRTMAPGLVYKVFTNAFYSLHFTNAFY